jgi:hypothetical protein
MPAPACTDGEFIELWKTLGGNSRQMAERLGVTRRQLMDRRRRLERRHNLRLESTSPKASHYKHLSPVEHTARRQLECQNGVVIVFSDAHFLARRADHRIQGVAGVHPRTQAEVDHSQR